MKHVLLLMTIVYFPLAASAQVFKAPDGVFPIPGKDSGFDHGLLMIRQKEAGGAFIEYPKDKETIEQLKKRLADYILPMFLHGAKPDNPPAKAPALEITQIPSHKGDQT